MVERSGCNVEESTNGGSLHHDESSTNINNFSIIKNPFDTQENINNTHNNKFSIFKWFKRNGSVTERQLINQNVISDDQNASELSSSESVDTYYSTATVKSFAFHSGTLKSSSVQPINLHLLQENQRNVGPFGSGASKVIGKIGNVSTNVTQTLPANVLSRTRDITTRYSLQSCTINTGSCNNIVNNNKQLDNKLGQLNRSSERRVHVKGKRRAPNPPTSRPASLCSTNVTASGKRKRRPAPKPPEPTPANVMDIDDEVQVKTKNPNVSAQNYQTPNNLPINKDQCNDTLVLHDGVLISKRDNSTASKLLKSPSGPSGPILFDNNNKNSIKIDSPSSAMPRPWYKRSVFENSSKKIDNTRAHDIKNEGNSSSSGIIKSNYNELEKSPNEGSLSRLKFFYRDKNIDDKRKDIKRRSGLSILMNISELDKEAAAIVQEEQARQRALLKQSSLVNDMEKRDDEHEVIQNMVTSAMESSPRRGTRALISKFNAIGNITKVTVNSSFFNKNSFNKEDNSKVKDNLRGPSDINSKVYPDLSRYFPQRSPKLSRDIKNKNSDSRLSFFHNYNDNINKKSEIVEKKIEQDNLISDVTNRLTLQNVITKNSSDNLKSSPIVNRSGENSRKELIINDDNDLRDVKKVTGHLVNSPKVLRTKDLTSDGEKKSHKLEAIQREFTNIFDAMDKQQLSSTNLKQSNQLLDKEKKHQQVGTSSQVNKVLDILLETQKNNNYLESNEKSVKKSKALLLNKIEDPTTIGLKEMLKEMKHSLPKRPKPNRTDKLLSSSSSSAAAAAININEKQNSHLMNAKIIYPPIIHVAPGKKLINEDQCNLIKQNHKVSSAVQTCGNVRKIITNTSSITVENTPSTSQTKYDDIIYKTMRNKFQLMRPREFAAIGAIKTMRSRKNKNNENTYANVIEQSLYANALVLPSRNQITSNNYLLNDCLNKNKSKLHILDDDYNEPQFNFDDDNEKSASHPRGYLRNIESKGDNSHFIAMAQKMNTMAINRLTKKLGGAIASGNHQQAAKYAKELATLQINCSVIINREKNNDLINVHMYIEDRLAHQGPIPLQLAVMMTVGQLKEKISNDFNIPVNIQRWIINKTLAENNEATLKDLRAIEGSPVFLYLVAPDLQIVDPDKRPNLAMDQNFAQLNDEEEEEDDDDVNDDEELLVEEAEKTIINSNEDLNDKNPLPIVKIEENEKEMSKVEVEQNPGEFIVHLNTKEDDTINIEMLDDVEGAGALTWNEKPDPASYQELIDLEGCDIVPNKDFFECPICIVTYEPYEGVVLRDCLHTFCRTCLIETIKYCDDPEVKCPYYDPTFSCPSTLQEREIKALVDPSVYELHLTKSISQAENKAGPQAIHCKTPNCPYWCFDDEETNNFVCQLCKKTNCVTCRAIHEGQNCLAYQEYIFLAKDSDPESQRTAAMLANMLDNGEAMRCPTCKVLLMKKMGCDWIKCSMCKTELCWVTKGPRWGPGGVGDISSGCRCKVNGIKCHPLCSYCH